MDNLQPGQMLGPYRIINQIGQGGMATVYKAYRPSMDRHVAVKVLPSQLAESTEFLIHPIPLAVWGCSHGAQKMPQQPM